jgi:NADPH2:quinone reductase
MKAIWYEKGGVADDVLHLDELETPEPGEGEVRVKIAYSAVNPFDIKKRVHGRELATWDRIIPHADGSGEIDKLGAGVPERRIGESVWLFGAQFGQARGTCAHYCVLPAWKAVTLPAEVSLEHGACLGIPVVTALESLSASEPIEGKTVMVAGGAGRVGAYAVQIAKRLGAKVIATASKEKCPAVEHLGAERCFDYGDPGLQSNLRDSAGKNGFDLIVEPRFASNVGLNAAIVSRKGVIAAYGVDDDPAPAIPVVQLVMKNASCRFVGIFGLSRSRLVSLFERTNELIAEDGLQHRIGLEMPLEQVAQAHQQVENGSVSGAALIRI